MCSIRCPASLADDKAFWKYFPHTRSTRGWHDVLTSLDFADKPAEHYQLFPHSLPVDLNSSPCRWNLSRQIVYATFWSNSSLEDPFGTFLIPTEQFWQISLNETQEDKMPLAVESPFTFVLHSSGRSVNYLLRMRAQNNWIALYNGVYLISAWLLLSYQQMYVIAHITCNHPVHDCRMMYSLRQHMWHLLC
jgi:hypothetical protein